MCLSLCICIVFLMFVATMIIPADITTFNQSEVAREYEEIYQREPQRPVLKETFIKARDYIAFKVLQGNAQRPAAVLGITEKNVAGAKVTDEGAVITASLGRTNFTNVSSN